MKELAGQFLPGFFFKKWDTAERLAVLLTEKGSDGYF